MSVHTPAPSPSDQARRRRRRASARARDTRVLVWEPPGSHLGLSLQVRGLGFDVIRSNDIESAMDAVSPRPPDLVLVTLMGDQDRPSPELLVLKRALPGTPFAMVATTDGLRLRERFRCLRPIYWAVTPLGDLELRSLLAGAPESRSSTNR